MIVIFPWDLVLKEHSYFATPLSWPPYNRTFFFFCRERRIFSTTRVSSIFSSYLFIWLYMVNILVKYSEILFDSSICNFSKSLHSFYRCTFITLSAFWFDYFDSSICNFSKSLHSFYRCTFITLSAFWFDYCKISYACLVVVVFATISKVALSKHWWMIVSACWSFLHVFCTTSLWVEVNFAPSTGSSKSFSTISYTSCKPSQFFTLIHQVL